MTNRYTVDYFINKFKAIPRNRWCTGSLVDTEGRRCALGHCQIRMGTPIGREASALIKLMSGYYRVGHNPVAQINDDTTSKWKHPRTRILMALKKIKQESL